MIERLESELLKVLSEAQEVWIASALVSETSLDLILRNINSKAKVCFLVGINLPTNPRVLTHLLEIESKNTHTKIYINKHSHFHPKVYIAKVKNTLSAFVGSANLTTGGMSSNVELTVRQEGGEARKILEWFNTLFLGSFARPVSKRFIARYSRAFRTRRSVTNESEFAVDAFIAEEQLGNSNFKGQFFTYKNHIAYSEPYWEDYGAYANSEREAVRDKLLELHESIFPQFQAHGLNKLFPHHRTQNITSLPNYRKFFSNPLQKSLWLHYGKSERERLSFGSEYASFLNHARIQIIFHSNDVGIWLVLGKDGTVNPDKNRFEAKLNTDRKFMQTFFYQLKSLPGVYTLRIGGRRMDCSKIDSLDELISFCTKSDLSDYFIISNEFAPESNALSRANIESTVLTEFQRLYSIYLHLKA